MVKVENKSYSVPQLQMVAALLTQIFSRLSQLSQHFHARHNLQIPMFLDCLLDFLVHCLS